MSISESAEEDIKELPEWEFLEIMTKHIKNIQELKEFGKYVTQKIAAMKNRTELLKIKNTVQQIKNSVESLNNGMSDVEERISDLEDTSLMLKHQRLKRKLSKTKKSIQKLRDIFIRPNVRLMAWKEKLG